MQNCKNRFGISSLMQELIDIYDIAGKLLKTESKKQQGEIVIDVSPLATGFYFLKIDNNNLMKFVKE